MVQMPIDLEQLGEEITEKGAFVSELRKETHKVIIGQDYMLDKLLIGLLTGNHILLEGMPGLAKTLAIKTLASAVEAKFSRIQFTPDLLPADLVGTMIYNPAKNEFNTKKGPIFANFVLADEINRAPAKVQSALLEAMQEKQVTIGETTHILPKPFMVMATQNPIDQEGTYPLPEAQRDRFLLKVKIDYPNAQEEREIIRLHNQLDHASPIKAVANLTDVMNARHLINRIYLDERIEKYIIDLVFATRYPEKYNLKGIKHFISYGASPRASIGLTLAAKAAAFLDQRAYVIPEDIRNLCFNVFSHRIGLTFDAEAENIDADYITQKIIETIAVP